MTNPPERPSIEQVKGLPPGSLIHVGERKVEFPKVNVMQYKEDACKEFEADCIENLSKNLEEGWVTWIDISGIHDVKTIEQIGALFQVENLSLEDIMNTKSRPKYEEYENYILIQVKDVYFKDNSQIGVEQISFVLKEKLLITFQEEEGDAFDGVRNRLRQATTRIRTLGSDYLAYALLDAILDNIFVITDTFDEQLDKLENELSLRSYKGQVAEIMNAKKQFSTLRRSIGPMKEVVYALHKADNKTFGKKTHLYLRDLYDHAIQIADTIEQSRDTVSGLMNIYLSGTNQIMNNIMKTLTVVSTIFMTLSLIAGIYGMNFKNMPETQWTYAYFVVLGGMGLLALILILLFKKKKWLD